MRLQKGTKIINIENKEELNLILNKAKEDIKSDGYKVIIEEMPKGKIETLFIEGNKEDNSFTIKYNSILKDNEYHGFIDAKDFIKR